MTSRQSPTTRNRGSNPRDHMASMHTRRTGGFISTVTSLPRASAAPKDTTRTAAASMSSAANAEAYDQVFHRGFRLLPHPQPR